MHGDKGRELRGFKLFLRAYIYAPEQATFVPVPDMPRHLPGQIRKALHDLHKIETAGTSSADLTPFWVQDNSENEHVLHEVRQPMHLLASYTPVMAMPTNAFLLACMQVLSAANVTNKSKFAQLQQTFESAVLQVLLLSTRYGVEDFQHDSEANAQRHAALIWQQEAPHTTQNGVPCI